MGNYVRKRKLIKPRLQLRLTMVFLLTASVAVLAQFILLNRILVQLSHKLPEQADVLLAEWPGMLATTLGLTIALVVPFTLGIGVLTTFRIAGPLYRFETYMRQVARGEDAGPCRIRKGDMLQEHCDLLNEMVVGLRSAQSPTSGSSTTDVDSIPSLVAEPSASRNEDARTDAEAHSQG